MKQHESQQGKHLSKSKRKKRNRTFFVLTVTAAVVFIVSGVALLTLSNRNQPEEKPEVSLPPVVTVSSSTEPEPTSTPEQPPQMLAYMQELYEQNPDLVGYISVDGTNIDGPVVYTANEDYYLYRGFDRQDHVEGCLYVDKHNTVDPRDANLLIHGHNMKNGTMFHDLLKWKDEAFYQEHKRIRFDSLYEAAEYEIIAVFVSQVYNESDDVFKYYKEYDFANEKEFSEFMRNIRELSLYDTGVDAKFGDEFITLSTCEYSREDGRMVVVARKTTDTAATGQERE